jgi:hypothetical protein
MKTSELTGAQLDWAVAKCEDIHLTPHRGGWAYAAYSTNWSQGGPIIEREKIELVPSVNGKFWYAESLDRKARVERCPTPLIAAMRCYVASKLGDDVEIPKELT